MQQLEAGKKGKVQIESDLKSHKSELCFAEAANLKTELLSGLLFFSVLRFRFKATQIWTRSMLAPFSILFASTPFNIF